MKVGKPGRVSIMIAHIHPASTLYTIQDCFVRVGHETRYRTRAIITLFFTAVYIVELLVLLTILQFLGLKSVVYN